MDITIIGAESLGARGLSCLVELKDRKLLIDPGVALGWSRHGLLPHPFQVAIGAGIREKIVTELEDVTDVVISHFDGDHCPLYSPNAYQLGIHDVKNSMANCRIWTKGPDNSSPLQQRRRKELGETLGQDLRNAERMKDGSVEFSFPVPHGLRDDKKNMVMMTKITEQGTTFVHASDIQLLDEKTIDTILYWKPDIVLASGPPLYHYSSSSFQWHREQAWRNALRLSSHADTLIIDHHLLRSEEGVEWLDALHNTAQHTIMCAAGFMKREPLLLEAWRKELYEWLPVSRDWHGHYSQGIVDFNDYRSRSRELLISKGKIKPCKWYYACPIKYYTNKGKLEPYWIENYCLVSNKNCIRYEMEEQGTYHPDNMLPNGETREDL